MIILFTTRNVNKKGKVSGKIKVNHENKNYLVKYEQKPGESWFQWGAADNILCHTTSTVEKLCSNEY